jgi:hypothetical protein
MPSAVLLLESELDVPKQRVCNVIVVLRIARLL